MVTSPPERYVKPAVAHKYWAKHAYEVLVETAGHYNATITYSELAEEVQRRSNLWTQASMRSWVGGLLVDLAKVSHLRGEPALTALVVHKQDGQVGPAYDEVLREAGLAISDPDERELHAAAARLECYRHWGADVPEGATPMVHRRPERHGSPARERHGSPAHSRSASAVGQRGSAARSRGSVATPRRSAEPRRGAVCPTCFMEMPVAGPCPNCG